MSRVYAIVCKGCPDYLPKTISRLARTVPGSNILLVGDDENFHLSWEFQVNHVRYKDLENRFPERFRALEETFKNGGPNPDSFEIFCFQRFIYLEVFMEATGIESVIHVDADILVYSEPNIASSPGDIVLPAKQGTFYSKWSKKGVSQFNRFVLEEYFFLPPIHRYCDMDALEKFSLNDKIKGVEINIVQERGYEKNRRLDLSLTSFLITEHFEKNLGQEIPHHSAQSESLPIVPEERLKEIFEVKHDHVRISDVFVTFVHLQGCNKRYFDFFIRDHS